MNLTNTIVSLNSGGDISGSITSGASNLVGSADIALAPLANYGGPTMTMPPLPGSPAIDTGSDSVTNFLITDQRGAPRKVGLHVDVGAVEGIYNPAGVGQLTSMKRLDEGSVQFTFTNFSDMSFSVLASTNVSLPLNLWTNLGPALEAPAGSGQFFFNDPQTTNNPQRFYRVRNP